MLPCGKNPKLPIRLSNWNTGTFALHIAASDNPVNSPLIQDDSGEPVTAKHLFMWLDNIVN